MAEIEISVSRDDEKVSHQRKNMESVDVTEEKKECANPSSLRISKR